MQTLQLDPRHDAGAAADGTGDNTRIPVSVVEDHPGDPAVWRSLTMTAVLATLALAWSARQFARSVR